MKVLLSIKPEYAHKILSGEKRFEFRKAVFKDPAVRTVVIYATMPVGKVIGEFDVESVISACPDVLWRKTKAFSGITRKFFDQYFLGRDTAYAIEVKKVRKYSVPLDLNSVLPHSHPPQSFCYLY
ncbi:ASCH domain-containing protein [Achromobacter xylosoxidans]|uniref:ASCH domain-containing protein n=1 Tax=Alcaligenes xylosoxydans xylosoxydans TaxID=85698 RepID=A0A9X3R8V4_ALCXX|nr:ASCH domain-containing protein [Achromobacter xylosoxidans]MCZ8405994.1 ASCH domain-containing protein [Achromobacter xylosoxidans]